MLLHWAGKFFCVSLGSGAESGGSVVNAAIVSQLSRNHMAQRVHCFLEKLRTFPGVQGDNSGTKLGKGPKYPLLYLHVGETHQRYAVGGALQTDGRPPSSSPTLTRSRTLVPHLLNTLDILNAEDVCLYGINKE